ncbi:VWA domain-containing protein [Luteimicrobium subarcticum]|uniref:VWA domain containing CoxE-like protein n=1 Tax=Luteimicrobium subarcticum TaxID=620910 RepID=A0A2M8WRF6_9MICO|nr:VWA domain-containing protein [Luteimicrobium subarcticum]PJI93509.1 VWA domain containing CoxE-like protein [Luteimicrobium subarcticum]
MTTTDRWRLVLGRYAHDRLPAPGDPDDRRREDALERLYGREYAGRGGRGDDDAAGDSPGPGGLGASAPDLVAWLGEVRELFPRETVEVVERHALDRYGLTGLVTDPDVLARLEPNESLLKTLLALRGSLDDRVLGEVRRVVRTVVDDLRRRLESEVRRALTGRLGTQRHTPVASAQSFDPRGTIRANLKNWDAARGGMVVDRPLFFERNVRRVPWDVILLVDQSGSMAGSVIHSAVMAGILAGLPTYRPRVVVFDTSVVDLSAVSDDPVEMLLSVQLGGGTDIAQAVRYAEGLVVNPHRTVVVLVTDFCAGGPPSQLVAAVRRLVEAQVTTIGLASLDTDAHPSYDRRTAQRLVDVGMPVAALTPGRLAEWLAEVTAR